MPISSPRVRLAIGAAGVALTLSARAAGHPQIATSTPDGRRSVWAGVYTEEQAARGLVHYYRSCIVCHEMDLLGDPLEEIPSLADDAFLKRWRNRSVKDLLDKLSGTMPTDAPASLSSQQYVELTAYILQANKFPSGSQPLDRDSDLGRIVIENAPAGR